MLAFGKACRQACNQLVIELMLTGYLDSTAFG